MSDNNNNAKTMYEAVPAAAELNKVPGFDPLKFLRRWPGIMNWTYPIRNSGSEWHTPMGVCV